MVDRLVELSSPFSHAFSLGRGVFNFKGNIVIERMDMKILHDFVVNQIRVVTCASCLTD